MENGVDAVRESRAAENDVEHLGFGDGYTGLKDSEADGVFEEDQIDGGDEEVGKSQGMGGTGSGDDRDEIKVSEAVDLLPQNHSMEDGDSVLDPLIVRGAAEGEGVVAESASAAVENGEKEESENGDVNSDAVHTVVRETVEVYEGIEDDRIPDENHRLEKSEDGVTAVEEKIEESDVSAQAVDDGMNAVDREMGEVDEGIGDGRKPDWNHMPEKFEDGVTAVEEKIEESDVSAQAVDDGINAVDRETVEVDEGIGDDRKPDENHHRPERLEDGVNAVEEKIGESDVSAQAVDDGMNAVERQTVEVDEGIGDDRKPNENHIPEKFEDGVNAVEEIIEESDVSAQAVDDGMNAVEEKIEYVDVSDCAIEDEVQSVIFSSENLEVSTSIQLIGVAGQKDGDAMMEVSSAVKSIEGPDEKSDEKVEESDVSGQAVEDGLNVEEKIEENDVSGQVVEDGLISFEEKIEESDVSGQVVEDGLNSVEEKMEDIDVSDRAIEDEVQSVIFSFENVEVLTSIQLNGVAEQRDGDAMMEVSAAVESKGPDETSENGVWGVDEKHENGNYREAVSSGEFCAGVHEESENGDPDEASVGKIHSLIYKKPENGIYYEESPHELSEHIQHQNRSSVKEVTSGIADATVDEKIEALEGGSLGDLSEHIQRQNRSSVNEVRSGIADATIDEKLEASEGKSEPLVGVTEITEKSGTEIDQWEAKNRQDSQVKLSGETPNGCSDQPEATIRTKELRENEDSKKQDKKSSFAETSASSEVPKKDFVSLEEYDASSSTDEDETLPGIQHASTVSNSSGYSADPPAQPAALGSSASMWEPAPRVLQQPRVNGTVSERQSQLMEDHANGETEEYDETREKLQMIRVKFLRLARRLGQTPHNVVVAQVLYRLGLAEQLRGSRNATRVGAFSFDRASAMAEQLEAASQEPLDFSCTIMVIGKTGVGKSATINSIFDEVKFSTDAFQLGTKKVQDIVGTVQGIKVRVIDTPGLLSSCLDQHKNKRTLESVKLFIKKTPPDIVLYLDRLDMQSRDFGDVPLLRTITDIFGPSIWFNAIVVLTHAASAPPDGPSGIPLSYDMFVTQRSHVVQQAIRQAAGDMRLMNPVSLVENHSACRTNRAGQRVLPNGQVWKPHLLLLSFASKILAEANALLKLQDSPSGNTFGTRSKIPPLPFLLSSFLQSRPQLKLPEEQFGDDETMDDDLDESSDSDDELEYNELPPFKRLTKSQLAKLSKEQEKAYFDEVDYREKLFMKKQLKEEKKRRKLLKKMAESAKDLPNDYNENLEEDSGNETSVPIPDRPLPSSFDSDNPTHRYRHLDNSNQWLVMPVLETHGWDHDVGYEGVNVERLFVVKDKIPVSFSGQVSKDKKEANLQMELASSIKHGVGKATSFGFDMQTVGKDLAYTLRSEMRFSSFRCNKTSAGLSVNILGDALSAGLKCEDTLLIRKRLKLVMAGGAMTSRGEVAYGGTLEATLRDEDYPLGRMLSTLGLSIMDWHGDLAMGCNLQTQFPVGRTRNMILRANLNNKGSGQVSFRLNSSEQLQIALVGLIPVLQSIKSKVFGSSQPIQ